MRTENILPINAMYLTWLRDKGCHGKTESKRVNKKTGEVKYKTKMDSIDLLLYIMLLSRADKDTLKCYPSLDTICRDTMSLDRRTAWDHLQDLEQMGFIEIQKARGKPNLYYLKNFAIWRDSMNC